MKYSKQQQQQQHKNLQPLCFTSSAFFSFSSKMFSVVLFISLIVYSIAAVSGSCGDDGVYFQCSSEPGDIPIDIAVSGGILLPLGDDETSTPISLSFPFQFYTKTYTSVRVDSNGFLPFEECCTNCTYGGPACNVPEQMPDMADVNAVIGAFWTDLDPSANGTIHIASDNDNFRVQWTNVPQFSSTNSNTFQVHLMRTGDFWVYLRTLEDDSTNQRPIVTGVENQNGTRGFSMFYAAPGDHSRPATPVRVHFAVNNRLPPPVTTGGSTTFLTTATSATSGGINISTTAATTTTATPLTTVGINISTATTSFLTTTILHNFTSSSSSVSVSLSNDGPEFSALFIFLICVSVGCFLGIGLIVSVYWYRRRHYRIRELIPVPTTDDDSSSSSFESDDAEQSSESSEQGFEDLALNDDEEETPIYVQMSDYK